nr:unnamed protein product [Callosobruchus analis]
MAAEAEAAREARAKVIAAEGEQKASRALREASEVIGDSPAALQLRYLQVRKRSTVTHWYHRFHFNAVNHERFQGQVVYSGALNRMDTSPTD